MPDRNRCLLWITERYPPLSGGMAVSCGRQVENLRRRGVSVDVIALTGQDSGLEPETIPRDNGADFILTGQGDAGLIAQRAWPLIQAQNRSRGYDFVVGFGAGRPGWWAVIWAAWLNLPALVQLRGNDFERSLFDPRLGWLVQESLSRAAVVAAVSPDLVRRVRALFPDKPAIFVPNGLDPAEWALLPRDRDLRDRIRAELGQDGRRIIGLFGELKAKKRVPLLLGALRDSGRMGRAALLVVGRTDQETGQLLADPVLAPPVLRQSFTRRDELPGLYSACDFVALPSLSEGLPNVLLEAMACGAVPIVSDAGAMAEVVQDKVSGFTFPAEDRAAAAQALTLALDLDQAAWAGMSAQARERVGRDFSPEREIETLLAIFRGEFR